MAIKRMELHCHSEYSDGTCTPQEILRMAARAQIDLLALTDHDTMDGVEEAVIAGQAQGVTVLPALEMDTEWPYEMHILGLDVDPACDALNDALSIAKERRVHRNAEIVKRLRQAGFEIGAQMERYTSRGKGCITRLHIAAALCEAHYAGDIREAFSRLLAPGTPGYYAEPRFSPREVIGFIRAAGGLSVLAHPCQLRQNPHAVVRELSEIGIGALEAYYPSSTQGQTELFVSLARQYHLLVTCGSDFHGKHRAGTPLGCAWREKPSLLETREYLLSHHVRRNSH